MGQASYVRSVRTNTPDTRIPGYLPHNVPNKGLPPLRRGAVILAYKKRDHFRHAFAHLLSYEYRPKVGVFLFGTEKGAACPVL